MWRNESAWYIWKMSDYFISKMRNFPGIYVQDNNGYLVGRRYVIYIGNYCDFFLQQHVQIRFIRMHILE